MHNFISTSTTAALITGLGAIALLGVGSTTASAAVPSAPSTQPPSILSTPPLPETAVPASLRQGLQGTGIDPDSLRPGTTDGDWSFYVGQGPNGTICIVNATSATGFAGASCGPVGDLQQKGAIWNMASNVVGTDGSPVVAGIAPDGYSTATIGNQSAPIKNNVFALKGGAVGSGEAVTLLPSEGSANSTILPTRTLEIGGTNPAEAESDAASSPFSTDVVDSTLWLTYYKGSLRQWWIRSENAFHKPLKDRIYKPNYTGTDKNVLVSAFFIRTDGGEFNTDTGTEPYVYAAPNTQGIYSEGACENIDGQGRTLSAGKCRTGIDQ